MANIAKLEFIALDISGKNYMSWTLDADIHLISRGLGETIKEGNKASDQDRAKALIFLRHHLHDDLKTEYLTVKDPQELWMNLKDRFDHQKTVVLPKARYEWMHLRLQDFKSQQYRERGFKKYSELIACLLVAEQNNELLLKNHALRPTGSAALPEANATFNHDNGRGRGNPRGRGRGRGRGYGRGRGRGKPHDATFSNKKHKASNEHNSYKKEGECQRCGMTGHWARTCRTAKHLADLYQDSIKGKGKKESNNVDFDGPIDTTHLDVSDFFYDPKGDNIDQLIGGGVLEDNNMDTV
ncbi:uncharacterized protein LOC130995551 [Salvia miltiorrhiza]|uniref:uncharacterized protein LOC130995551 n=1 Tax=Salvia miltiorrhiza TaxID=226208 RepID=UPI0025AC515E|nr:uncharacterized protein LOC130995551 [Salvia miltiorrhiza]XP_057776865.1 uncharacterized protein LOC130995551 [Salvia miltiorrhiza]